MLFEATTSVVISYAAMETLPSCLLCDCNHQVQSHLRCVLPEVLIGWLQSRSLPPPVAFTATTPACCLRAACICVTYMQGCLHQNNIALCNSPLVPVCWGQSPSVFVFLKVPLFCLVFASIFADLLYLEQQHK